MTSECDKILYVTALSLHIVTTGGGYIYFCIIQYMLWNQKSLTCKIVQNNKVKLSSAALNHLSHLMHT